jgi:hypothetical protein
MAEPVIGIVAMRDAVRRRVNGTSLRNVAFEVGMSFSGLRTFLHGARPHPATRRKLVAWYTSQRATPAQPVRRDDVDAAITLLARFVRNDRRAEGRARRVKSVVERLLSELDHVQRAELKRRGIGTRARGQGSGARG